MAVAGYPLGILTSSVRHTSKPLVMMLGYFADMSLLMFALFRSVAALVVRAMSDGYLCDRLFLHESIGVEDDQQRERKGDSIGNKNGSGTYRRTLVRGIFYLHTFNAIPSDAFKKQAT